MSPSHLVPCTTRLGRRFVGACLIVALLLAAFASGCGSAWRQPQPSNAVHGVVQDEQPPLTPEQRDRNFRLAYNEGLSLAGRRDYGLALGAFEAALLYNPRSIEALFNLGACHEALGDPFRAISIYRRVLEIDPYDADCYANIGTCCIKLYHRERTTAWRTMAHEAWRRSLELAPEQPDIQRYLSATGASAGE